MIRKRPDDQALEDAAGIAATWVSDLPHSFCAPDTRLQSLLSLRADLQPYAMLTLLRTAAGCRLAELPVSPRLGVPKAVEEQRLGEATTGHHPALFPR